MSADNYNLIRKHPDGGYAVITNLCDSVDYDNGDPDYDRFVDPYQKSYPTLEDAFAFANTQWTEYGTSVDPECYETPPHSFKVGDKVRFKEVPKHTGTIEALNIYASVKEGTNLLSYNVKNLELVQPTLKKVVLDFMTAFEDWDSDYGNTTIEQVRAHIEQLHAAYVREDTDE